MRRVISVAGRGERPRAWRTGVRGCIALGATLACIGCGRLGGTFESATDETDRLIQLTWVMVIGGAVIWAVVLGVAVYAAHLRPRPHGPGVVRLFLFGGGVAFPVIVLAALLVYGLRLLASPVPGPTTLRVEVTGERWWWRVAYVGPDDPGPVVLLQ